MDKRQKEEFKALVEVLKKDRMPASVERTFRTIRFGKNDSRIYCAVCGYDPQYDGDAKVAMGNDGWFRCNSCGSRFTVKTNSAFHQSKVSLDNYGAILYCILHNKSVKEMLDRTGITRKSLYWIRRRMSDMLKEIGVV